MTDPGITPNLPPPSNFDGAIVPTHPAGRDLRAQQQIRTGVLVIDVSSSMSRFGQVMGREIQPAILDGLQRDTPQEIDQVELRQVVFADRTRGAREIDGYRPPAEATRWDEFTYSQYRSYGTALYLAVAQSVQNLIDRIEVLSKLHPGAKIEAFVAILTDGQDTASRDCRESCLQKLAEARDKYGVQLFYSGIGDARTQRHHDQQAEDLGSSRTTIHGGDLRGLRNAAGDLTNSMTNFSLKLPPGV